MPSELTSQVLAQTLCQVLEEAAFVFAEVTDDPPEMAGDLITARITYGGPNGGELILATTADFAGTLAANLLGEDEGGAVVVGDDQDAVGEMINMIAGALVVVLFGTDVPCALGLPRVERVAAEDYERELETADAAVILLEEQGRRVDLSARLLPQAPA